jgi:hypothetical protein
MSLLGSTKRDILEIVTIAHLDFSSRDPLVHLRDLLQELVFGD